MEVIVAVIILLAMGLLVGFSLAWYALKLRCLNYEGRAEGIVVKFRDRKYRDQETKEIKLSRSVTAEYVVDGITYKARTNFGANELYEGSQVTILYDEARPSRYVFEHEIADVKSAKKRWLIPPMALAILAVIALVFLIPSLSGFTKQQKYTFNDIIRIVCILMILVLGALEMRKKHRAGMLTKKYVVKFILAAILTVILIIECFFPMIIFR